MFVTSNDYIEWNTANDKIIYIELSDAIITIQYLKC